jgi:tetratricopeptide (TPR) repeat protein
MSLTSKELSVKAASLRKENKFEEALLKAKSAANLDPSSADAWWQIALCNIELKNTDSALEALAKTLDLSEEFSYGWAIYGKTLREAGQKEKAIEALERALEIDDSDQTALSQLMGIYAYDADNRQKFIKHLITYEETYGLITSHYINVLGNHYLAEGNNHLAIACYKRLFDEPDFPYGRHNVGLAYFQSSQLLNAIDSWAINLKNYPEYEPSISEFDKKIKFLREKAEGIAETSKACLSSTEWYKIYLNPFLLLDFRDDSELDFIDPKVIQTYRKKLLQEIDLEDGKISWMNDFLIDKSRAISVCDELNNETKFEYHAKIFKYKPLLTFLTKGDISFFLTEPDNDLIELLDELSWNDDFASWLSPYFSKQFNNVFKKSTSNEKIYFAMLGGRLLVTESDIDSCFESSRDEIDKLLIPLRELAKQAETIKPSLEKLNTVIQGSNLVKKIKALPVQFIDLQDEAAKIVRNIAIDANNIYDDGELSKKILDLSKQFTFYKSSLQKKLEDDSKAIDEIITNQKKDESVLVFGKIESYIKKDGARYGETYIPVDKVTAIRWGTTVSQSNYSTSYNFSMVISGAGQVINLVWSAPSETDKSKELFDKHVGALLTYIFPPLLERIKLQLKAGLTLQIGPCKVNQYGVQFETKGWFSNKSHNVSWKKIKANLSNGELHLFSIDNYSEKIVMSLKDTNNVFVLYILATGDER